MRFLNLFLRSRARNANSSTLPGPRRQDDTSPADAQIDWAFLSRDDKYKNLILREWVFQAIDNWLRDRDGPRFFMLTGAPGTGKTAIALQLCHFAEGKADPPASLLALRPNFLNAVHFCNDNDISRFNPLSFAKSITTQLEKAFPFLAEVLIRKHSGGEFSINIKQQVLWNSGNMTSLAYIDQSTQAEDVFIRLRDGIEEIIKKNPQLQVIILVDALDEALSYLSEHSSSIPSLLFKSAYLSKNVRFILSTRPDSRIRSELESSSPRPREIDLATGQTKQDIRRYIDTALKNRPKLRAAIAPGLAPERFAQEVESRSEHNFLYVYLLFKMIEKEYGPQSVSLESLVGLPRGLNEAYKAFLKRIFPNLEQFESYKRLLGILAVSFDSLREAKLARLTGRPREVDTIRRQLSRLSQFFVQDDPESPREDSDRPYAFYHSSFAEFLLAEKKAGDYWCGLVAEYHECIASYHARTSVREWDEYDLRYAVLHLAEAIRLSDEVGKRHELIKHLVDLVKSPDFQEFRSSDLAGLHGDLRIAVEVAATDDECTSPLTVVQSVIGWKVYQEEHLLAPERIFQLAERGELNAAQHNLALFDINPPWHQAVMLTLAWLAAEKVPAQAHALFTAESKKLTNPALDNLSRMIKEKMEPSPSPATLRTEGCQSDHLRLCDTCTHILTTLMTVYGRYRYEYYRNDDLWIVLDWMLRCCKDANIAQKFTTKLARTALTPNRPEFRQGLYFTALAVRAREDARLKGALDKTRDEVFDQSQPQTKEREDCWREDENCLKDLLRECDVFREKTEGSGLYDVVDTLGRKIAASFKHGRGDCWAFYRRQCAVLAYTYKLIQAPDPNLLKEAMRRDLGGFPGCHVLALLFVAETIQMMNLGEEEAKDSINTVLDFAAERALEIQDARHCAINMSRIRAMRQWFPGPLPWKKDATWAETVKRFLENPEDPIFAAVHVIGEDYPGRSDLDVFTRARTLEELKSAYGWYPLSSFEQLNTEWAANENLPEKTRIRIPTRRFESLIACRLAAGVVGDKMEQPEKKRLIQRLVPVTLNNPTALDTMLSRLLLVADPCITQLYEFYDTIRFFEGRQHSIADDAGCS